ncbi:hypothetical protein SARC_08130 [Sphaeroforma arctica JP610]|uniref:Uncharacterized protein n=1 Tax=Sphaeroforma arctica JP610 TaxID=667725 RepID=A0A0L0FRT3_9EUKA|nr:hypothetical protein SARC_08130 [Sphaeroforma arctica JP610]KNC79475.1 hypothetical protein SARC_08130 [Sphaeroforma arctica JP610]|eukprot:XP_014153377.1 hypothetical protein SARC_08130 [Sphaeroforma arctica JP610]
MNAITRQISVERQIAGAADRIGSSSGASKKIGSSSGRSQAKKYKETIMARIKELDSTLNTLRETQGVCSQRYSLHLVSYACHNATDHTSVGSVEGLTTGTTVGNGAVGVPGQGKARPSPNDGDVESEAFGQNSGLSVRTVFFPTQMARDEVLEQLLPAVTRQSMCTMESLNQYLNQAEERDTGNEAPHTPEFMSAVSRLSWLDVDDTAKRGIYSFTKKGSKRMVRRDYVICCQRPSEPPDASLSMSSFDTNSQWGASWSSLAEPSLITLGKPSPLIVKRGSMSSATSMLLHHKQSAIIDSPSLGLYH